MSSPPPHPPSPRPPAPRPPAPPYKPNPIIWRTRAAGTTVSNSVQGEGVFVIVALGIAFTVMAGDWAPPEIVFTVVNSLFHTAGIVTDAQASAGYGNTGLLTVVFLYLVAEGIYQTGALEGVMVFILGKARSPFWAIVRVCVPVMCISAFLNNTPVVALMISILLSWSRRTGVPAKKILIPLAFSATMGGTCTLIGTSANLVIWGQQTSRYAKSDPRNAVFGIFDIAPYGVPYAIWGFLFIVLTQAWLLPGNSSKFARDLLMAIRAHDDSTVIGKSLLKSGLLEMTGVSVVGYTRNGTYFKGSNTDLVVDVGDVFYVVGELTDVEYYAEAFNMEWLNHETEENAELAERARLARLDSARKGKTSKGGDDTVPALTYEKLLQVTIAPASSLIGQPLSMAKFTQAFKAKIVAFKSGAPTTTAAPSPISDTVPSAGDILVLNQEPDFDEKNPEFGASFVEVHRIKDGMPKPLISSFVVTKGSLLSGSLINKTISEAGLRGIPGLHVFAVDRAEGEVQIDHIDHDLRLQEGDIIWISLDIANYIFLRKMPGLLPAQKHHISKSGVQLTERELTQAVIAPKSFLIGKTLSEVGFREKYAAAVVGLHRGAENPERVHLAETVLQESDILLLESTGKFANLHHTDRAFSMLSRVPGSSPPKRSKGGIAVFLGFAMVMTQVLNGLLADNTGYKSLIADQLYRADLINLWPAAVLTALLMLVLRCMTCRQATDSIMWDVYLTVAGAFGVSNAVEATGVAEAVANVFISISQHAGGSGAALVAIYISTALLSEILTNNAAGAVMYPIAATVGDALGISPVKASVAIMLGASAGFINPFSYQCNLMVYSAGNYTFKEFAIVGAPFQAYLAIVAGFILVYMDQWHEVWIVSWIVVAGILALAAGWTVLPRRFTLSVELWLGQYVGRPLGRFLWLAIGRPVSAVFGGLGRGIGATKRWLADRLPSGSLGKRISRS